MHHSRSLVALAAFAILAGCGVEESELDVQGEQLVENTAEAEQALTTAKVWFTDGDGVNVRSTPSTSGTVLGWLAEGTSIGISCQTTGTTINGTNIWDYLPGYGGYVTDAYVLTGYDGFIPGMPMCDAPPPPPSSGTLGATIVSKARAQMPYTATAANCNKFSSYYGNGCIAWCSDYARYVWQMSGAKVDGLSASSITFYNYGIKYGTWKPNKAGVVMKPGDAVIWAHNTGYSEHVGIVTEVSGSTFRSIHGNFYYNGTSNPSIVHETSFQPLTWQAGTGAPILGFISPVQ
ncbi:CHAP domain-containing protein [Polyangium aurulentum]|uniref:CHAP domain-containing protein n=1 Tax=Polyangium aurulentum TaxID=2567896 RepID=UPI0010AE3EB9|nr:CHAP domain-containing protein [Polyangium aurulentum]UQA57301.1 CHAP domain-containing protein [Polyangium aurulentum]